MESNLDKSHLPKRMKSTEVSNLCALDLFQSSLCRAPLSLEHCTIQLLYSKNELAELRDAIALKWL